MYMYVQILFDICMYICIYVTNSISLDTLVCTHACLSKVMPDLIMSLHNRESMQRPRILHSSRGCLLLLCFLSVRRLPKAKGSWDSLKPVRCKYFSESGPRRKVRMLR